MKPITVVVKFMVVWETGCYFFVGPLLVDKFVGCDHGDGARLFDLERG